MPTPTPTSLTLNDLLYNSLNSAGYIGVVTIVPVLNISVSEIVRPSENVSTQLPGFSYAIDTSDFIGSNDVPVVVFDPNQSNQFSVAVSDTTRTAENSIVTGPFNPANTDLIVTSDTSVTGEGVVVTEA